MQSYKALYLLTFSYFHSLLYLVLVICYDVVQPEEYSGKVYPLLMEALLGIGDGVSNTQRSALLALLCMHDMV